LTELSHIRIYEVRICEVYTLHEDLHTVLIILVAKVTIVSVVAGVTHTPREKDGERTRSARCPCIFWLLCLEQYWRVSGLRLHVFRTELGQWI